MSLGLLHHQAHLLQLRSRAESQKEFLQLNIAHLCQTRNFSWLLETGTDGCLLIMSRLTGERSIQREKSRSHQLFRGQNTCFQLGITILWREIAKISPRDLLIMLSLREFIIINAWLYSIYIITNLYVNI